MLFRSDLHQLAVNGPAFDLPTVMSKFLALGMDVEAVVARATAAPAKALGRDDLGTLRPGAIADVVVGELLFSADDAAGEVRSLDSDLDVALADAEETFAALVDDLDLDLVQIAAELVERREAQPGLGVAVVAVRHRVALDAGHASPRLSRPDGHQPCAGACRCRRDMARSSCLVNKGGTVPLASDLKEICKRNAKAAVDPEVLFGKGEVTHDQIVGVQGHAHATRAKGDEWEVSVTRNDCRLVVAGWAEIEHNTTRSQLGAASSRTSFWS